MDTPANRLSKEKSAYLLQHAHNPVDWYPWGEEALSRAGKENKPILVSIGYAACHWCHVMERETFENHEIAEKLNKDFISIKVDREERPDIDQIYMTSVQLMTGAGGWPLNCFLTPDAKPFFGGTYFHAGQFTEVLNQIITLWQEDPSQVINHADNLCEGIINSELIKEKNTGREIFSSSAIYNLIRKEFDCLEGGLNRVPKFPMPGLYLYLLTYSIFFNEPEALQHVELTVEKIIEGGIYDQLAGGISRYSTDKYWFVPHFEKMLYDNAQFIGLLSLLYSYNKKPGLAHIIAETIDFLDQELSNQNGGYYSSLDADSEGEEGKFYLWTANEIAEIAGKDRNLVFNYFGIENPGNWEQGKNILKIENQTQGVSFGEDVSITHSGDILSDIKARMLKMRNQRPRPVRDEKILTSWNALMISGLIASWNATSDDRYYVKARLTADFLIKNMMSEDHSLKRGVDSKIPGFLDDYAYTVQAFIDLYQANFENDYLDLAKGLMEYCFEHFYDAETGMYFYSPDTEVSPVTRQKNMQDSVLPSANSTISLNLYFLSVYLGNDFYKESSSQMLKNILPLMHTSPVFFSNWARRLILAEKGIPEIIFIGKEAINLRRQMRGYPTPLALISGSKKPSDMPLHKDRFVSGKTLIYICRDNVCLNPVLTIEEALKSLLSFQRGSE